MRFKIVRAAIVIGGALLVFLAGYATGQRTTFNTLMPILVAETQGNLAQRIETLARLRTGDSDGAVAALEEAVDSATLTLSQGKPWAELDSRTGSALQLAKAYRAKYPASQYNPTLDALLYTIPMPDVKHCSPAMRRLLSEN